MTEETNTGNLENVTFVLRRRERQLKSMLTGMRVVASEPGAVATGQRFNLKNEEFAKRMESIWPVATALGSDVDEFLCKTPLQARRSLYSR